MQSTLQSDLIKARDEETDPDKKALLRKALRELEDMSRQQKQPPKTPATDMAELEYRSKRYDYFVKLSKTFKASTMVNPDLTEADIFYIIEMGDSLGLSAPQALQTIASINGKPSIYGDGMSAVVRNSKLCKYIKETNDFDCDIADAWAECETLRVGEAEPVRQRFTMKMAMQAGLYPNKKPEAVWNKYWQRMLTFRARGWCLRDVYADALRGLSSAEEQQDIVLSEEDYKVTMPVVTPQQAPDMTPKGAATTQQIEHQASEKLEFSLNDMVARLRDAVDMKSLLAAKAIVKKHAWTDADKTQINTAYSARRSILKQATAEAAKSNEAVPE
jgi:hypothetical protein